MIHLKIEAIGEEFGIIFDQRAIDVLGIAVGGELQIELTEGGFLLHVPVSGGERRTFRGWIEPPSGDSAS